MSENQPPVRTLREVQAGDLPMYTPGEAIGAVPNGTRVRKVANDPGDTHTIGDLATIIASHGPIKEFEGDFFYFVVWDDLPNIPVGIRGRKLGRA